MNIVYFSYNFFPQADAESYCATRFASALVRAGHRVIVVTMDWTQHVSEESYKALVADELEIIRLPFSKKKNSPLKALLWYGHKSQMAVNVPQCVEAVEKLLKTLDNPILITRTMPIMSSMVGLKVRKHAQKWIAHFSDPVPWTGYANTLGHKLLRRLEYNIVKKTFIKADKISVTCQYVCQYFKDEYGKAFSEDKVIKLTHIGDYRLGGPISQSDNNDATPILLHPGTIYARRGGNAIAKVMKELDLENYKCKFVQVGNVDNLIKNMLVDSCNVEVHDTISLEKSLGFRKKAKAIFIPDFESYLAYSPVLLSKFVYQIMDNTPIVLYSYKKGEMHDYAEKHPEAGIFFAEIGDTESLKGAIKKAMECDNSKIDRSRIRQCFAEKTIVGIFNKTMAGL